MALTDNDTRGWIMSAVSGIACIVGSGIICIDLILRKCLNTKDFYIISNNNFLSSSLSLSAGVMIYSSLYSMLPTAKDYLIRSGLSESASSFTLIGLFLAGVIVIRFVSAFIHHYIPSHIVDCSHSHEAGQENDLEHGAHGRDHSHDHGEHPHEGYHHANGGTERTPLLPKSATPTARGATPDTPSSLWRRLQRPKLQGHHESLSQRFGRHINQFLGGAKLRCDETGPCYGFSQKCGRECRKILSNTLHSARTSVLPRTEPMSQPALLAQTERHWRGSDLSNDPETPSTVRRISPTGQSDPLQNGRAAAEFPADYFSQGTNQATVQPNLHSIASSESGEHAHGHRSNDSTSETINKPWDNGDTQPASQHHHHVPQNAFLSIGLQTSMAIALHKLPEGFITYATNHASPTLGLTVFIALFIHNITEGFAMALPLFLALNSRWKAILWSSLLGGISQPAGAGIAALWIWGSNNRRHEADSGPSWGVYGGMFAATAGVMTSVALQLFCEALSLTHRPNLCIGSAVAGMGILGFCFALTA